MGFQKRILIMLERPFRQPVPDRAKIPPDPINVEPRHDIRFPLEEASKCRIGEEEMSDLPVIPDSSVPFR